MGYNDLVDVSVLMGKTLKAIDNQEDELVFITDNGEKYRMYHSQNCCERVDIEDIAGDIIDLIGSPILLAEEETNREEHPIGFKPEWEPDSFTWTYYRFATIKGYVTIRWYGTSNGYYSESVSFEKINKK